MRHIIGSKIAERLSKEHYARPLAAERAVHPLRYPRPIRPPGASRGSGCSYPPRSAVCPLFTLRRPQGLASGRPRVEGVSPLLHRQAALLRMAASRQGGGERARAGARKVEEEEEEEDDDDEEEQEEPPQAPPGRWGDG